MRRVAAGLRPGGVADRRRQHDLGHALIDRQARACASATVSPLAGQRRLVLPNQLSHRLQPRQRAERRSRAARRVSEQAARRRRSRPMVMRLIRPVHPPSRFSKPLARPRTPAAAVTSPARRFSVALAASVCPWRRSSSARSSLARACQALSGAASGFSRASSAPDRRCRAGDCAQMQAGEVAQQRVGGAVGGDLVPQRGGAGQVAGVGLQRRRAQARKGPVAVGRGGRLLVERGDRGLAAGWRPAAGPTAWAVSSPR